MLKHKQADVGVAVAIEGGLFTPVIRNAEPKVAVGQISQRDEGARRRGPQAPPGAP